MRDGSAYGRDRRQLAQFGLLISILGFVVSPLVHAIVAHGGARIDTDWVSTWIDHGHGSIQSHDECRPHWHEADDDSTPDVDLDKGHSHHDGNLGQSAADTPSHDESRPHSHGGHGHSHRIGNLEHLGACFIPSVACVDVVAPILMALPRIVGRAISSASRRIRSPEEPQGP